MPRSATHSMLYSNKRMLLPRRNERFGIITRGAAVFKLVSLIAKQTKTRSTLALYKQKRNEAELAIICRCGNKTQFKQKFCQKCGTAAAAKSMHVIKRAYKLPKLWAIDKNRYMNTVKTVICAETRCLEEIYVIKVNKLFRFVTTLLPDEVRTFVTNKNNDKKFKCCHHKLI